MILGFDIDGVLYPWHKEVWKWYSRRNKEHVSFYEFWKWPNGWIANNEGSSVVKAMVSETLPYVSAKADDTDVSVVNDIAELFIDEIYYITSRPKKLHYDTEKWLSDSGFPFVDNLIMADGNGGKVKVVEDVGCDYYVEDRPKYLEVLPKITTVFQMTQPYNSYRLFDAHIIGNLVELYQYLDAWGVRKGSK